MAYDFLEEFVSSMKGDIDKSQTELADEEVGLGPRRTGVEPPSGYGVGGAIKEAFSRGYESFKEELTAPIRDIPEGIQYARESMATPGEGSVLDRLKQIGGVGLGGATAGLSLARSVFSPVTAAARTVTEAPLLAFEHPDDPRPENAETARKVGQFALEAAVPARIASKVLARLRVGKAVPVAKETLALKAAPDPIDMTGGRELKGDVLREAGPIPDTPTPPYSGVAADVELPRKSGESATDYLRRKQRASGESIVSDSDLLVEDIVKRAGAVEGRKAGETVGQYIRRQKRMREEIQNSGDDLVNTELTPKDLYPDGMPKGMSLREWVKLQSEDGVRKVKDAANELDDVELDAAPIEVQKAVRAGSKDADPNRPDWLTALYTKLKIRFPLSMTQIAKGDPLLEEIVKKVNDSNDIVQRLRDDWTQRIKDIAKKVSKEDFEGGIAARDKRISPANANQGQVATLFGEISDEWAKALSLDPDHPNFLQNYVPRIRQAFKIIKTEIRQDNDWVSEDILSHFPSHFRPYFTRSRRVDVPSDNYGIDAMIGHSNAVARASVYGTPQHHGLLKDLEPLLRRLKDRPADVQDFMANYLNYVVGHPSFRSSEFAQKMGGRMRSVEFMRTIGANLTSPVYNSLQRALTFSEVSTKAFAGALKDEVAFLRGDKDLAALLKKAHIPTESLGPRKLETETVGEGLGKGLTWLSNKASIPFGFAERGNRVHAFFAGYRNSLSKYGDEARAIGDGRALVQKTQFMPGPGDKPQWMRGEFGATIGQFKYFQTKLGEYMWGNFSDMFKRDADMATRAQAAGKFLKFWGTASAIGGPTVIPFIGGWLEEQNPTDFKGLGPALGVAVTDQLGLGAILPKDVASLKYYLPGPIANHMIDILNGVGGVDVWNPNTPSSTASRARALTRSFPVGGVQMERIRKASLVDELGNEREPMTAAEATPEWLGGTRIPSTRPLVARDVNPLKRFIGFADPEQEQEYRMMDKLNKANVIKNQAISKAQQLIASGDRRGAQEILRAAEDELGLPRGRITLSPQSKKSQKAASQMTPVERRRKASGHALRDYGLEDTLP